MCFLVVAFPVEEINIHWLEIRGPAQAQHRLVLGGDQILGCIHTMPSHTELTGELLITATGSIRYSIR